MGKVEPIFDYNPTERELKRLGFDRNIGHYDEQIELYKEITANKHTDYYCLFLLFSMRGEKERAAKYLAKAPSWQQDLFIQDF
jgi:ABC-type multidrug transport system ATPase subunit